MRFRATFQSRRSRASQDVYRHRQRPTLLPAHGSRRPESKQRRGQRFGTFIVFDGAVRELSHQAVHPIADSTTEIQAVTVFRNLPIRAVMCWPAHAAMRTPPGVRVGRLSGVRRFPQRQYDGSGDGGGTARPLRRRALVRDSMARDGCVRTFSPRPMLYPSHGRNATRPHRQERGSARQPAGASSHLARRFPGPARAISTPRKMHRDFLLNGVGAEGLCGYIGAELHAEIPPH